MVGNASLVCKHWLACVLGPYCWSKIDILDWSWKRNRSIEDVDSMARKLMESSQGAFWLLSAYKLGIPSFLYAANCGKNLKVLKIPKCEVTDEMVEIHAGSLMNLCVLDISYCSNITSKGIEEFGNKCKCLIGMIRNMLPPNAWNSNVDDSVDDSEAMAIANTMPGLRKLEMRNECFGDLGLDAILTNCKALSHLDIEACWKVTHRGQPFNKCLKIEYFRSPWDAGEFYVDCDLDNDSD